MQFKKEDVLIGFVSIILMIFMQACVSWTQIAVMQPGFINLPDNIDTIAVFNRINPSNIYSDTPSDSAKSGNSYIYHSDYTDIDIGDKPSFLIKCSDCCINGLYNRLNKSNRFEVVLVKDSTANYTIDTFSYSDTHLFPPVLTPSAVKQICFDHHAQGLLVLEGLYIHSLEHTRMYNKTYNSQGPTSYFAADLKFSYSAGFRLYQAKDGSLLDVMKIDTSKIFSIDGVSSVIALNDLLAKNDFIPGMMAIIDGTYAKRLIPFRKYSYRNYFVNFNIYMLAGAKYVKRQNWLEARAAWEKVYNKNKVFRKAQAAYNLALSYENVEIDLYQARKLASESYRLFTDCGRKGDAYLASAYLDTLNNRINALPKLNEQLGK